MKHLRQRTEEFFPPAMGGREQLEEGERGEGEIIPMNYS
jgi:hypothetical protein